MPLDVKKAGAAKRLPFCIHGTSDGVALPSGKVAFDYSQIAVGIEANVTAEAGEGDKPSVHLVDGGDHGSIFLFEPAAVNDAAGDDTLGEKGHLAYILCRGDGAAGAYGPEGFITDNHF